MARGPGDGYLWQLGRGNAGWLDSTLPRCLTPGTVWPLMQDGFSVVLVMHTGIACRRGLPGQGRRIHKKQKSKAYPWCILGSLPSGLLRRCRLSYFRINQVIRLCLSVSYPTGSLTTRVETYGLRISGVYCLQKSQSEDSRARATRTHVHNTHTHTKHPRFPSLAGGRKEGVVTVWGVPGPKKKKKYTLE